MHLEPSHWKPSQGVVGVEGLVEYGVEDVGDVGFEVPEVYGVEYVEVIGVDPQLYSSDPSPQSLYPSQTQEEGMHLPSTQHRKPSQGGMVRDVVGVEGLVEYGVEVLSVDPQTNGDSSDQSPQSLSPSHTLSISVQLPFQHWKPLQGVAVGVVVLVVYGVVDLNVVEYVIGIVVVGLVVDGLVVVSH